MANMRSFLNHNLVLRTTWPWREDQRALTFYRRAETEAFEALPFRFLNLVTFSIPCFNCLCVIVLYALQNFFFFFCCLSEGFEFQLPYCFFIV